MRVMLGQRSDADAGTLQVQEHRDRDPGLIGRTPRGRDPPAPQLG